MKFYAPEVIEVLKRQTQMSESTWHKIMHPNCVQCSLARMEASGKLVRNADGTISLNL